MASQVFTHTASTTADIGSVWASLDQPQTWEGIAGIDRVFDPIVEDGRLRGFSFESLIGGQRYLGKATPAERVEAKVMAWNIANTEIRGLAKVAVTGSGTGTVVDVTLEVASAGLLSGMFFPMIAAAIGNGLPATVEKFVAGLGASQTMTENHDPTREPGRPF